jgi:formylglycine-generating enzyme required for sulfatase activity
LLLLNGDQLTGTILNESFSIRTSYAQLNFNNRVIAGIDLEGGTNNIESIITVNDNRFSGFIDDPVFVLKLQSGPQIEVRREKVLKAIFRIRELELEGIPQRQFVTLKNGDFFSGLLLNTGLVAETTYADVPLDLSSIESITLIGSDNPLTKVLFHNDDSLQGILNQEDMLFELDVGGNVEIYQDRIDNVFLGEGFIPEGMGSIPGQIEAVGSNAEWAPVEQDFEGITMVLVPPGSFTMGSTSGESDERPTSTQMFEEPFWIDKTEVARVAYQACVDAGGCTATPSNSYSSQNNQPINRVSWYQAAAYCEWRGARLPTEAEWEYAARGPDRLEYPWTPSVGFGSSLPANYDDNIGQTTEVGSYPGGTSWVGAFDMAGNVWEWTRSRYEDYPYVKTDGREVGGVPSSLGDAQMVLRGGSFDDTADLLRSALRVRGGPDLGGNSLGFRCARSYSEMEQPAGSDVVTTLVDPGSTTGDRTESPTSTNVEWSPVEENFAGTPMVLVPAGSFTMGSTSGDGDERPTSTQMFEEPFWIDKTEVTREAYQACVDQNRCRAATSDQYSNQPSQPINNVTWYQAAAYCDWRGGRLPTEAEWEYVARGPDGLEYPWGIGFSSNTANNDRGRTTDVGSYPNGASWVGALDMAGNVWEWTRSRYEDYPYVKTDGREVDGVPSSLGDVRLVLRGGGFYGTAARRSADRLGSRPGGGGSDVGFRCARPYSDF